MIDRRNTFTKQMIASLSLLAITFSTTLMANCCEDSFYLKVGSGISFSQSAQVKAPPTTWNPAFQGYNSKLGNQAIAELALGYKLIHFVDLEVSGSWRSTFKYRKFQTPIEGGASYTREFDLDVTSLLFSVNLLGREISCLNWDFYCGKIYPITGVGVGVSNLLITNYRTTGLAPSGDSSPYASFSAENQYTRRRNFTYSAFVGFEYNYNDCFAISTGYRWLDAGSFKGPRYQRVASGAAVDVAGDAWKMRFRSNEWFVSFKIFL